MAKLSRWRCVFFVCMCEMICVEMTLRENSINSEMSLKHEERKSDGNLFVFNRQYYCTLWEKMNFFTPHILYVEIVVVLMLNLVPKFFQSHATIICAWSLRVPNSKFFLHYNCTNISFRASTNPTWGLPDFWWWVKWYLIQF